MGRTPPKAEEAWWQEGWEESKKQNRRHWSPGLLWLRHSQSTVAVTACLRAAELALSTPLRGRGGFTGPYQFCFLRILYAKGTFSSVVCPLVRCTCSYKEPKQSSPDHIWIHRHGNRSRARQEEAGSYQTWIMGRIWRNCIMDMYENVIVKSIITYSE